MDEPTFHVLSASQQANPDDGLHRRLISWIGTVSQTTSLDHQDMIKDQIHFNPITPCDQLSICQFRGGKQRVHSLSVHRSFAFICLHQVSSHARIKFACRIRSGKINDWVCGYKHE